MNGTPVYVIDGCRTPFLKAGGRANPFSASDLAVAAGRTLLLRQPFKAREVDEVILGCVMPAPDEANIARIAALRLGCGDETTAWTVQRNCASGMQALDSAVSSIRSGRSGLILAGGVEAMSRAPLQLSTDFADWLSAWYRTRGLADKWRLLRQLRPHHLKPVITLLKGLTDPIVGLSMGQTAEILARRFAISREEMDRYAVGSHQRLAAAQDSARLQGEMTPIIAADGTFHEQDDGLRRDASVERLQNLSPAFDRRTGLLTAGNSAQITDGACLLLLADEATVRRLELTPLGRISAAAWAGLDPAQMGLGPVHAIHGLFRHNRLTAADVDHWEINEAFAAQVLACTRAMADPVFCREDLGREEPLGVVPVDRLNGDGGAISIGHPVGASGARIVWHLLHRLRGGAPGARRGVAALCIGGGQGGAMLAESV